MEFVIVIILLVGLVGAAYLLRGARLLAICPNVFESPATLVARTSLKGAILTLGLTWRRVTLSKEATQIEISHRYMWLFRSQRSIAFNRVERVLYSYDDLSTTSAMSTSGDTWDHFSVKLKLSDGETVHLFHFLGDGEFQRGSFLPLEDYLPDWMYWGDRATDFSGSQEAESRKYVDQLSKWLNVPVAPN